MTSFTIANVMIILYRKHFSLIFYKKSIILSLLQFQINLIVIKPWHFYIFPKNILFRAYNKLASFYCQNPCIFIHICVFLQSENKNLNKSWPIRMNVCTGS